MGRRSIGSVRRKGDAFEVRITIGKKPVSKTFRDEQVAQNVLVVLRAQAARVERNEITLNDMAEILFNERESKIEKSVKDRERRKKALENVAKERSVWKRHVGTWLRVHRPIGSLKPVHVHRFLGELSDRPAVRPRTYAPGTPDQRTEYIPTGEPIARQTAKHAMRLLRNACREAAARGHARDNVMRDQRLPAVEYGREEGWTWLTLDEIVAVFMAVKSSSREEHNRLVRRGILALAIFGGLRLDEAYFLRWEDVDLDGERPHVWVTEGKSTAARRTVPLVDFPLQALREWKAWTKYRRPKDWVFARIDDGGRHDHGYDCGWADRAEVVSRPAPGEEGEEVKRIFPGLKTRAGITRRVRLHDLRHTFVSHMLQGTFGVQMPLEEIAPIVGHSSAKMTARYGHLDPHGPQAKMAGATVLKKLAGL